MNQSLRASEKKLEEYELWRTASQVATAAYAELDEFPEEEKWGMSFRLRGRAFDMTTALAEAYGSIDPRDKMHSFGKARESMFGLKNSFLMAHKTNILSLDPSIMMQLNDSISAVNKEIAKQQKNIPNYLAQFEASEKKERL